MKAPTFGGGVFRLVFFFEGTMGRGGVYVPRGRRCLSGPGVPGGLRGHPGLAATSTPLRCGAEVFRMCPPMTVASRSVPGKERGRRAGEVSRRGGGGWEFLSRWAMEVRSVLGLSWEGEECG